MATEAAASQAARNPEGASIFLLNTTSVTVAVEAMMAALPDHIFQLQEIKKDYKATAALSQAAEVRRVSSSCFPLGHQE